MPPRAACCDAEQPRWLCHLSVRVTAVDEVCVRRPASAVRPVRKRKVLVLNGRFRPKRSENGLYQSHTARTGAGNSTSVAPRHPGSLFRPSAHLLAKPHFSPFCLIWGLSLGVSLRLTVARAFRCAPPGPATHSGWAGALRPRALARRRTLACVARITVRVHFGR